EAYRDVKLSQSTPPPKHSNLAAIVLADGSRRPTPLVERAIPSAAVGCTKNHAVSFGAGAGAFASHAGTCLGDAVWGPSWGGAQSAALCLDEPRSRPSIHVEVAPITFDVAGSELGL